MQKEQESLLYEGKAKRVFRSDHPDRVLVEFKNDATAFNAIKREQLENKGRLNCQISAHLFEILEEEGIPNHYLGLASLDWMVVQHVNIIPLEVVIRNVAAGSLCRETPIPLGTEISPPLLDLYYKEDSMKDPLITEARIDLLCLVSVEQRKEIEKLARGVNEILKSFFGKLDLLLVDFKLEFGLNTSGQIIVADEISPDTCRLWDKRNNDPQGRILDKDRFRQDLGGVVEAYGEILKRIQKVCSKPRDYK